MRACGVILAVLPLGAGIWMMLWDDQRRCFQDRLARTLVVYTASEPAASTPRRRPVRSAAAHASRAP